MNTFGCEFKKENFKGFINTLLKTDLDSNNDLEFLPNNRFVVEKYRDFITSWEVLGRHKDLDGKIIDILIVYLKKGESLYRSRVAQRNFVADYLRGNLGTASFKDAVLVAFVSPGEEDWRFSFVKLEGGRGDFVPARRWSFLVGKNEKSHTTQSRFLEILKSNKELTLEDIQKAFDIDNEEIKIIENG
jgi:hypothetical protein